MSATLVLWVAAVAAYVEPSIAPIQPIPAQVAPAESTSPSAVPKPNDAVEISPGVRIYLDKLAHAREARDRGCESQAKFLSARRAELERQVAGAKRGTIIVGPRQRLPDGSVLLNNGRSSGVFVEPTVIGQQYQFTDEEQQNQYIARKDREIVLLDVGLARLADARLQPIDVNLDFAHLVRGEVGALDVHGAIATEVSMVVDGSDLVVVMRAAADRSRFVWISRYATRGIKEKSLIVLSGPFMVSGERVNPLPQGPHTLPELEPVDLAK